MRHLLPLAAALSLLAPAASALERDRHVAAYRAALVAACRSAEGTLSFLPGFDTRAEFNGDGRRDLLLDNRELSCDSRTTASVFCGTGGCDIAVFIAGRSGFVKAFKGSAIAATIVPDKGGDRLSLSLHGTHCDLSGAEQCLRLLAWDGRAFAPLP